MKPWKRRGQKARDSEVWRVSLCVLSPLVDEIPVSYVAERLAPHLVKVGRRTECEAMIRRQLFERVPIALQEGQMSMAGRDERGSRWIIRAQQARSDGSGPRNPI